MADYGLLTEVISQTRSAALASDAAVSDTELEVDDAGDFSSSSEQDPDGGGGTLLLNGTQLAYTDITWGVTEDDTDLILLAEPLAVAASEGDAVTVIVGGLPAEDWYAVVDMGDGDNVHVPLTFAQRAQWPAGIYEPTPVQVSDDLELIEDAPGRPAVAGARTVAENGDEWAAAGDATDSPTTLTYKPLPRSLMVFQNGLRLKNSAFSLVDRLVTVLAAETTIAADDAFSAYYDHDPAAATVGQGTNPGGSVFGTVSFGDVDGFHGAQDHELIEYDGRLVALFTTNSDDPGGSSGGGGFARVIDVAPDGTMTMGALSKYFDYSTDSESSGNTHRTRRVGSSDLIVQWRRSGWFYTLQYDPGTDTFVRVDRFKPSLTGETDTHGGLVIPVSDDTVLLVRGEHGFPTSHALLAYAKWNGTSWDIGTTLSEADHWFGDPNYQDGESLGADGVVVQAVEDPSIGGAQVYALIAPGSYPSAPVVSAYSPSSGEHDYFNRQMYPASQESGKALRFCAVATGTTTPITGGSSSFDWGMCELSVVGGEVVESAIVNMGATTGYYDIAAAQTSDGHTWAVHETSTTSGQSTLMVVRDEPGTYVCLVTSDGTPAEDGISGNDYSIRCSAAAGDVYVIGFYTNENQIFGLVAFPADATATSLDWSAG